MTDPYQFPQPGPGQPLNHGATPQPIMPYQNPGMPYPQGQPYPPPYGSVPHPFVYPQPVMPTYGPVASKSSGLAVLLAFFFGPLGLLYATVTGGLVLLAADAAIFLLTVATFGLGAIGFFFTWIGGMVWAYVACEGHNRTLSGHYPGHY